MIKKLPLKLLLVVFILMPLLILLRNSANAGWDSMSSGTTSNLEGIWGSSGTDVFAVGDFGTILHYDGNPEGTWSQMNNQST